MKTIITSLVFAALFLCASVQLQGQCNTVKINGQLLVPGPVIAEKGTLGFISGTGSGLGYRLFLGSSEIGSGGLVSGMENFPIPNTVSNNYTVSTNFGINSCNNASFNLHVIDCVPFIVCPGALELDYDEIGSAELTNWLASGSSESNIICRPNSVEITNNLPDLSLLDPCVDNIINVDFTLTVTDAPQGQTTGIVDECRAVLTIKKQEDTEDPVVRCQNISITLDDDGNYTLMPDELDNGSSDNCEIAMMVVSRESFSCTDLGEQEVTLTVTDVNGRTASEICTVTVNPSSACISEDDFSFTDPCNCENPENVIDPFDFTQWLFHDVLELKDVSPGLIFTLTDQDGDMLDDQGQPLSTTGNVMMTEVTPGNYELVFYHKPDIEANFTISLGGIGYELNSQVCVVDRACLDVNGIPTMGQWALVILGLILASLGLVYYKKLNQSFINS